MFSGLFHFVCANSLVCGNNFGEIREPYKGDSVRQVIGNAYDVPGVFDKETDIMAEMKSIILNNDEQRLFGRATFTLRYEDENKIPVIPELIITPRCREDKQDGLWTTW